ncbi:amidase [Enemella evansiae]|nr:amidase [Enemella evansiae]OYO07400.1 amidase [Enemella evansiae]
MTALTLPVNPSKPRNPTLHRTAEIPLLPLGGDVGHDGVSKEGLSVRADAVFDRPLPEIVAAVRAGAVSARELTEESGRRIDATEAQVRAWVRRAEDPGADATALDTGEAPLPLHGIPLGVKDIIDVEGLPTRCGSPLTAELPKDSSAACVRRLQELGCVVQGKTVTTEFAYFAPGPTNNPAAPGRTPGGSSSGSAAAVAAGMVPLALGSQTAGSLTRPASFCGIAGITLAHGSTDLSGVAGLSPALDALGLLTRSVPEVEYAWRAFTGAEPVEHGGRVLIWRGSGLASLDPAMQQAVDAAADALDRAGTPDELDWDDHVRTLAADHPVIMAYEAVRERTDALAHLDRVSSQLIELLRTGQRTSDDEYAGARYRRDRSQQDLSDRFGQGDVIVGPAALGPAPEGLSATGSPILSRPWQALGLPVVTVPGIRNAAGLPLGIQVIGRSGSEGDLFRVAGLLADALRGHRTVA